jgi:MFS transporter, PHS family, inorganic phosphate transporter
LEVRIYNKSRIALAFGAIPAILAFVMRILMSESHEFLDIKQESFYQETRKRILIIWKNHKIDLLATSSTWLIFDIAFYANGIFLPTIVSKTKLIKKIDIMGLGGFENRYDQILYTIIVSSIVALIAIPGYIVSSLTIVHLGRKNIQLFGFAMISIIYIIMGVFYENLKQIPFLFVLLYGLTFFFSNFGPNVTTYVLPAVTFGTEIKSTCSGFSAASGKVGAFIGTLIVGPLLDSVGISHTLSLFGAIGITGLLATALFVKEKSNDEIQHNNIIMNIEDQKKKNHLKNNLELVSNQNTLPLINNELVFVDENTLPLINNESVFIDENTLPLVNNDQNSLN